MPDDTAQAVEILAVINHPEFRAGVIRAHWLFIALDQAQAAKNHVRPLPLSDNVNFVLSNS